MAISRDVPLDKPQYTKAGVPLRQLRIDEKVVESFYGNRRTFTVLTQSIPDGVTVPKGTAVDVTMAITGDLPFEVFPNIPERWQKIPIKVIAEEVRNDPEILKLMRIHETTKTLDAQELKMVIDFLEHSGLPGAAEDVEVGFDAARAAHLVAG
jgi:hypothetical protein